MLGSWWCVVLTSSDFLTPSLRVIITRRLGVNTDARQAEWEARATCHSAVAVTWRAAVPGAQRHMTAAQHNYTMSPLQCRGLTVWPTVSVVVRALVMATESVWV